MFALTSHSDLVDYNIKSHTEKCVKPSLYISTLNDKNECLLSTRVNLLSLSSGAIISSMNWVMRVAFRDVRSYDFKMVTDATFLSNDWDRSLVYHNALWLPAGNLCIVAFEPRIHSKTLIASYEITKVQNDTKIQWMEMHCSSCGAGQHAGSADKDQLIVNVHCCIV